MESNEATAAHDSSRLQEGPGARAISNSIQRETARADRFAMGRQAVPRRPEYGHLALLPLVETAATGSHFGPVMSVAGVSPSGKNGDAR